MVVPRDGFANSCEGARVHGKEMDHLSCYMTVFVQKQFKLVLEYPFANGCEGARVHGMETNHLYCQMAFPLGGNSEGARAREMEMNHMSCFNPTLHGVFQGLNSLAKPSILPCTCKINRNQNFQKWEMVVLLCGMEMNHISCYMTAIILELQQ